jgi:VCBS repeat-containing protein
VIVDPGVTLSDADNTMLSSATITVTGNFAPEDILSFANTNLSTYGNIEVVSYIAGVLRLDSPGATATLTQWQNALQAVTYSNASDDPNTATRTISFVVNDGADDSAPATRDVSITSTNDPAVISGTATGAVTEAGGVNNGTPGSPTASQDLDAVDPDNPNDDWQAVPAGAATSNQFGSYEVTAAGVWTYTLDNDNATVQALNVASTPLTDSFTVFTADSTPQVVTVTINGADDAPTLNHNTSATVVQGADIAIAVTQLDFDDLDNADAQITYTLDTTTTTGTLWLDANNSGTLTAGEELLAGESFTQADIGTGRLHYAHNGSATTSDAFQFDVSDGAGGSVNDQVFTISIVFSPPPPPSTTPSSGDDDITGTEGPDTIAALAGSDTVRGLGGNDLLFGNQDRDSLLGGRGDDTVWGGLDNDAVQGNEGSDLLFGNEGADTVDGGDGNNTIVGGQDSSDAADSITAGAGADLIWGNGGADTIVADGGSNALIGGFGSDTLGPAMT